MTKGKKNFGFGRQMAYAIRNALRKYFGEGRYSTRRSHCERLRFFESFLRTVEIRDLRQIREEHLDAYGLFLAEQCSRGDLSASTASNRLSSVNVLLSALQKGELRRSARGVLPARTRIRLDEPKGISPTVINAAVAKLIEAGEVRLAVMVGLARYAGCRFREASLFDLRAGRRSIQRRGEVVISEGTKGGRGKSIPRHISADPTLADLIHRQEVTDLGRFVIPCGWNYKRWYGYAHREWRKWAPILDLSSKFHDLRAAFACARYQRLTGRFAPCVERMCPDIRPVCGTRCLTDAEARLCIAEELGHGRARITDAYLGAEK